VDLGQNVCKRLACIAFECESINQASTIFSVHPKVDDRACQLSLPHVGMTEAERNGTKHKTDMQINPVNGLYPKDQSYRQKQ